MLLLMVGLALLILPNRPQPTLTFWDENHRSRTLGQQRIANCALHRVDDALYGTAICDIGNTVETRCTNATLVDCDRIQFASRNQQSPNPVNENKTITSSADRYSYPDSSLDIVFTDSNLTSTTQTGGTSFYMIELTQFAGKLSLTGCAIEGQFNPKLIGIVKITAKLEAFPRLVIEGCFVTFSCQTPLSAFDSQFQLQYSVFTQVSNSVFKAPEGEQTGIRLFRPIDSLGVFEMSGCRFQQQSTSGNGAVVLDSLSLVLTVFDSTFSDNTATLGGCFYSHRDVLYFHRCHFSNNVANMRGGVLSIYAQVLFHADNCHFRNNNALERFTTTNELAHYRGNDIDSWTETLFSPSGPTNIVGCTSTSLSPKIGYYDSPSANGVHRNESILLPDPETGSVQPPASAVFFVESDGSDEAPLECSEIKPCQSFSTALSKMTNATSPSKDSINLVNLGVGSFSEGRHDLSNSVELAGKGWMANQTHHTLLTTSGMEVVGSGNVSFSSLLLKPSTKSDTLLKMASSGTLRVMMCCVECLTDHTVSLVDISAGSTTILGCRFNSISLADSPLLSVSGTSRLTLHMTWFTFITRKGGDGGSCLDSTTSGTISISMSDFADCSSAGKAGVLTLTAGSTQPTITLQTTIFSRNKGVQVNDLIATGITSNKFTIAATTRSMSSMPHCLLNTTELQLQYPDVSFTETAAPHPLNARFNRGMPMSLFPGFAVFIESLLEGSTYSLQLVTGTSQPFGPIVVDNRKFSINLCPFTLIPQSDQPALTLRNSATWSFQETRMRVNTTICHPLISLERGTSLTFSGHSLTFLQPTHTASIITSQQASVVFSSFTMASQLVLQGSSFIEMVGGTLRISKSSFSSISSTSNGAFANTDGTTLVITNSLVANCTAKNGGVIFANFSAANYLEATHSAASTYSTTFSNCTAVGEGTADQPSGKGGVIFVKGTTTAARPIRLNTTSSNDARFEGNRAGEGNDVFVEGSVLEGKGSSAMVFGGGSLSGPHHVGISGRSGTEQEKEEIGLLIPQPKISVNGSVVEKTTGPSGEDTENCKWTSSFCATLGHGIKFLKQKFTNDSFVPQTIQFVWNMSYTETRIEVASQDISVFGTTSSKPALANLTRTLIEVGSDPSPFLFEIRDLALLHIENLDMKPLATRGLFDLTESGDSVEIESIGIVCDSLSEYSQNLFRSSKGALSLKRVEVKTSTPSSPASFVCPVVSFVSSESSLHLESSSLSCLRISKSAFVEITAETLKSVNGLSFSDCARTDGRSGERFFVRTRNLESKMEISDWSSHVTSDTKMATLFGTDTAKDEQDEWRTLSLLFFLVLPSESVVLDQWAAYSSTHPNCGSSRLPCSSLVSSIQSAVNHSIELLSVTSSAVASLPITIIDTLTIQSSSTDRSYLSISSSGNVKMNGPSQTLTLRLLSFSFDSSCSANQPFDVSDGSLVVASCEIGSPSLSTSLPSSFSCLFSVSVSASISFISTTVINLAFQHPTAGSVLHLHHNAILAEFSESSIAHITSNGTGSCVLVESLTIQETSAESAFLSIKSTIPIPSGAFTSTQKRAFVGKTSSSEESLLFFWFPHTSASAAHVHSEGENHANCGLVQLPCSTIEEALSRENDGSIVEIDTDFIFNEAVSIASDQTPTIQSLATKRRLTATSTSSFSLAGGCLTVTMFSFAPHSTQTNTVRSIPLFSISNDASLFLREVSFASFSSSISGTVIHSVSSGVISLSNVEISDCSCGESKKGRSVFISRTDKTANGIVLTEVRVLSSTSTGLHDFFISSPILGTYASSSWSSLVGTLSDQTPSEMESFWGATGVEDGDDAPLAYFVFPHTSGDVHVSSDFWDHSKCGQESFPCSSLAGGLSAMKESGTVVLHTDTGISTLVETVQPSQCIKSSDGSDRAVSVSGEGRLMVASGSLSLSHLNFTGPSSVSSTSFITISAASSLTVLLCSFDGSCDDGGVVHVSCSSGVGRDSLQIESTSFSSSCGSDKKGGFVFVSGRSFEELIWRDSWTGTFEGLSRPDDDNTLWGTDNLENESSPFHSVSLLFYLVAFRSSTIFASKDGRDSNGCGSRETPCRTLFTAHSNLEGLSQELLIEEGCVNNLEMELKKADLQIRATNGMSTLRMIGEAGIRNRVADGNHNVKCENIGFNVNEFEGSSVFVSSAGKLSLDICSFSRSSPFSFALVELTGGTLIVSQLSFRSASFSTTPFVLSSFTKVSFGEVELSDCVLSEFISAVDGTHLTLHDCSFDGVLPAEGQTANSDELCEWSTGLVKVVGTETTINNTRFFEWSEGGLSVESSKVGLHGCMFENNRPRGGESCARRNMRCVGNGTVNVASVVSGDGSKDSPSLWASTSDCVIIVGGSEVKSPLFIPWLSEKTSGWTKKDSVTITLVGEALIPCGVDVEIFEWDEKAKKEGKGTIVKLLPRRSESWTEHELELTLSLQKDLNLLNKSFAFRGRLVFGKGVRGTSTFGVKESLANERLAQAKQTLPWAIPIACGVLALLLIVAIVLVCLRRRKQSKSKMEEKTKIELDENECLVEKDPLMEQTFIAPTDDDVIRNKMLTTKDDPAADNEETEKALSHVDPVEAIGCDGNFDTVVIQTHDTLYERLHSPFKQTVIDKKEVQKKLTQALEAIAKKYPEAQVLTELSPHWVLFGQDGKMNVQLNEATQIFPNHPFLGKGREGEEKESHRWNAPELKERGKETISREAASVFSLGLVLWEIETGCVPHGEVDAVNAQRQLGLGERPSMQNVKNGDLREMLTKCLDLDPDDRPSLSELVKFFSDEKPQAEQPQPLPHGSVPSKPGITISHQTHQH
ncbi:hypothetical protein BLNAU_3969 [Blattamonas nauphoetae]|uniref:Protein kinase domain-containing protein n=1 Tax=Blattamonas nauphoetae TaxID=2049346 RepID=A0ABQ9YBP3_9EUKA|nr:hypothetical protein BLNAU_3969 [Blattamonas nauphoetae]